MALTSPNTKCRCGSPKLGSMIACLPCWQRVPLALQNEMYSHRRNTPERRGAARTILRWLIANHRPGARKRATS